MEHLIGVNIGWLIEIYDHMEWVNKDDMIGYRHVAELDWSGKIVGSAFLYSVNFYTAGLISHSKAQQKLEGILLPGDYKRLHNIIPRVFANVSQGVFSAMDRETLKCKKEMECISHEMGSCRGECSTCLCNERSGALKLVVPLLVSWLHFTQSKDLDGVIEVFRRKGISS